MFDVNKLRAFRERQGYSEADIARHLGVSQPAYHKYEIGVSLPNANMLKRIADVLDREINEFYS